MPVFFLFDSREILCRDDSSFSEVNLAAYGTRRQLVTTARDLRKFNFKDIYHDSPFSSEHRSRIIAHRNAEIVVPDELDLSCLKRICCRSVAEKDTLFDLLPPKILERWAPHIYVSPELYRRKWVFVETANLSQEGATFMFSPDREASGPFIAELRMEYDGKVKRKVSKAFYAEDKIGVPFRRPFPRYRIQLLLDEHVAYSGRYDAQIDEIPF